MSKVRSKSVKKKKKLDAELFISYRRMPYPTGIEYIKFRVIRDNGNSRYDIADEVTAKVGIVWNRPCWDYKQTSKNKTQAMNKLRKYLKERGKLYGGEETISLGRVNWDEWVH